MTRALVIDVGTSGVRAGVVGPGTTVTSVHHREVLPASPAPNFLELDATALAEGAMDVARQAMGAAGPVDAVGITNQRATTIVWDRATGEPVGPGIGWQDLRTAMVCVGLQGQGIRVAPNESATKVSFLLDMADPDRRRDLCFGTVDTWVAWTISGGRVHATDLSNAGVTGLLHRDGSGWNHDVLDALRIPRSAMPRLVDSCGFVGAADELDGAPPITAMVGDQQASLVGQGCTRPGLAKITFGTGGMLDLCVGGERPAADRLGPHGTFPIVAWSRDGSITWGVEAVMLTAGQAVEWLRDDLAVISAAAESAEVAGSCDDTGDCWFVPALGGLGAPWWDFGARATFVGITGATSKAQLVRAVLEGVAHRGADLVEAAEADSGLTVGRIRIDGGMSANPVFVQALADAMQRPVEVSPQAEATTLGAGLLANLAVGGWHGTDELAGTWSPGTVVEATRETDRDRWRDACSRAREWVPELSAISF